jgi:hypothetical protein
MKRVAFDSWLKGRIASFAVVVTLCSMTYAVGHLRGGVSAARLCLFEGQDFCNRIAQLANSRRGHAYYRERPINEIRLEIVQECIRVHRKRWPIHKPLFHIPGPGWEPPLRLPLSRDVALEILERTQENLIAERTRLKANGEWEHPDDMVFVASDERLAAIKAGIAAVVVGMSTNQVGSIMGNPDERWDNFEQETTNVVGYTAVYVRERVVKDGRRVSENLVFIHFDRDWKVIAIEPVP